MDVPHLTEDEMAEIKKDVLTKLRPYLCEKIRAERHLDYLRSRRILTRDDAEEISCRTTQTKRTGMLLDILAENPRGLDAMIESIQQSRSQNFIIARITDQVQKAKNEKLEAFRAGASTSSSDSNLSTSTTSSDLSRTFSNESTMLFHPDGEGSPSTSDIAGSLNLPSVQKGGGVSSVGAGSMAVSSSTTSNASSTLPRPGDPGAPPLPEELLVESASNVDAGAHGCSSSGGDPNFQPLRSRSLTPASHRVGSVGRMEDAEPLVAARPEERPLNGHCRWTTAKQSPESTVVEDFRRRLKYFFMNPCEKYIARGRKPWKLMLQILKIAIITVQLVSFGLSNEMMVTFKDENLMTFRHLFLKGYKDQRLGRYALYTKIDVYDHIHYIINRYISLQNLTVGNHAYERVDGVLLSVNIYLTLKTINLQTVRHHELPDCYDFHITVGGMTGKSDHLLLLFDSLVILACFTSLILCTRSIINGIQLQFEYNIFFHAYYSKIVSWADRMEFVNGWYILIIVSDMLTIAGSALKIGIQTKYLTNYDICSILLGTATMLVWIGVIRYLGFFKKYNFRTLDKVTECLFSLLNGDDMYSTFQKMRDKSYMVWVFSRLYLYSFISLFIYMVLSLFIAVITDTYETIKHHQQDKVPVSQLQAFIAECRDQPESGRYQTDEERVGCWSLGNAPSNGSGVWFDGSTGIGFKTISSLPIGCRLSGPRRGETDMGDWWTTETLMGSHEISSISPVTMSPSRQNNLVSMYSSLPLSKSSYSVLSAFCTEENIPQCISYINQEIASLGLSSTCIEVSSAGGGSLNTVPALNAMYELLQVHRRSQRSLEELEREQLKSSSTLEHLQISNCRLKDQLDLSKREKSGLHETERQLQLKIKTLQNCLKTEKDEVLKLQSIITSRASQYSHDAKRKERECAKLKERLSHLLVDKKDKKLAIDVLNYLGRSDGKRTQWKTAKVAASHEGEMYKSLLSDYEARQRSLMLENAELKKVLQQMKREMIYILSPRKPCARGAHADDSNEQAGSDGEDKAGDSSRETLDQSCEHAREQLTNSIRQQWRRLKNHMELLDSQASLVQNNLESDKEVVPREIHEEEMERMRLEVQQCKDFIHTQQQLLQQQLNSSFDDETAALLHGCYTLEDKERLKEEWKLFEEQKRNFERERKNFTDAAIRLGREKKAFEEDRASWLKNQFLNMTPFVDRKRHSLSDCPSALSIRSEPEMRVSSTAAQPTKSSTYATFSTPKAAHGAGVPSTAELYRTLRLLPESGYIHSHSH
ncbi:uncharacterized protein ACN63O_009919 [Diretmus argenteus]